MLKSQSQAKHIHWTESVQVCRPKQRGIAC